MKRSFLGKSLAITGLAGLTTLCSPLANAQTDSQASFSSSWKEQIKKVDQVKDVYLFDKYKIKASIDISQIPGFLDTLTNSNAENVSCSIIFDRSIFNQYWLKNNGNGTLSNGEPIGDEDLNLFEPLNTLADMDNDGFNDAIAIDFFGDQTVWLKNDGTGKFSNTRNVIADQAFDILAIGDFNGDGWKDVFVLNYGDDNENAVLLNNGQGTFVDSGQRLGNATSENVQLADLNGDGKLDAFVANVGANSVWLNDGQGNFTHNGQILGSGHTYNVALGDYDGNGALDAYVVNDGFNKIYLNNGGGMFNPTPQNLGNNLTEGVGTGDFNGDGLLDLIDANYNQEQVCTVWLNTGGANFTEGPAMNIKGTAIGVHDFNNDGKPDLFISGGPVTSYLMLGVGDGTFTQSQTFEDTETNANIIPIGDINNDGLADLFVSNRVYVYEGSELFYFEDTLDYAQQGEDEEKFNKLKIKDGVSGLAKFVVAEDVSFGDKPKYKKTLAVTLKWNSKKLNVSVQGSPTADSDENILDLTEDIDGLKENVSETNKKAIKKITTADQKETNFRLIFNGHFWDSKTIYYTGTESAKFVKYKDTGDVYTDKLGNWNVKSAPTAVEYKGTFEE